MAKKKQELSSEELLEEALVREEDWPYKVPGNWVWTRLGSVVEFERGITFPASAKNSMTGPNLIPCIRTANIQETLELEDLLYVNKSYMRGNINKFVRQDDIIMSSANSRELVGKVSYITNIIEEMTFGGFVLTIRAKQMLSRFLYFYLRYEFVSGRFMSESTQTTNIANIKVGTLSEYTFPLPPLAEQQRIVDRIESLFDKLDQAKDLIQEALDSFANRKAAILHQAFTGQLTKKWREAHGVGLESWEEKPIKEVAKFRTGYAFNSKEFSNDGYQVIRMGNLYNGMLDLQRNPVFISPVLLDSSIVLKFLIRNGDILLTLTGTKYKRDYGYAVLIGENKNLLLNQRIVSLTPEIIETNFLLHYLQTELFRNKFFSNETGGVNQGNVSSKFVENIKLPFPSLPEQQEIVRILDDLFAKEQNAKDLCDLIDQIEAMKKTILGQAFRGELGTNVVGDESSVELLERYL